jgi:hypothetical protein
MTNARFAVAPRPERHTISFFWKRATVANADACDVVGEVNNQLLCFLLIFLQQVLDCFLHK